MFDEQFYPTPDNLLNKIIPLGLSDKTILDPSAGKGNILDFLRNRRYNPNNLYAIEINQELQATIAGKGYKVLDSDFLNYVNDGTQNFDMIIMNPPFKYGVSHFLKAWEIANGSEIICILNAETIRNPFTKKRILLKQIIQDNQGTVEFYQEEFTSAERKTNVEIAVIKIKKPLVSFGDFIGMESEEDEFYMNTVTKNELIEPDQIRDIVASYKAAREHAIKGIYHLQKLALYQKQIKGYNNIKFDLSNISSAQELMNEIKGNVWSHIFSRLDLESKMTGKFRDGFQLQVLKQQNMAINEANISNLVNILYQTKDNIFTQGVKDVFEIFTKYHKENRCHIEGWHSNSIYMVNRKIVLPDCIKFSYGRFEQVYGRQSSEMDDIDKIMCYIEGIPFGRITTIKEALKAKVEESRTNKDLITKTESTFFEIKFYKKGTIHLYFKSKDLWNKFNYEAMKGNNWLPPGGAVKNGAFV